MSGIGVKEECINMFLHAKTRSAVGGSDLWGASGALHPPVAATAAARSSGITADKPSCSRTSNQHSSSNTWKTGAAVHALDASAIPRGTQQKASRVAWGHLLLLLACTCGVASAAGAAAACCDGLAATAQLMPALLCALLLRPAACCRLLLLGCWWAAAVPHHHHHSSSGSSTRWTTPANT
jgi:hypothetical protein